MEWLGRFNDVVEFIDGHLEDKINHDEIAKIACCSVFHFTRVFSYVADISLSEYIRRRKMTAAGFDLQTTDEKIIDIALKYGYDSPTAFNRAFKTVHGVAPSEARKKGTRLTAFPPLQFTLQIKGDE